MAGFVANILDPIMLLANSDIWTALLVYEQLVRAGKDGKSIEPDLAESWDISPDGLTYTFHLRPGLEFSDGSKLRSSDVRFSLERAARDPKTLFGSLFPPFKLGTPDERTVVLTLAVPHVPMLATLSHFGASILPQKRLTELGSEKFFARPVGSGPFVITDWKREDRLILQRNARYWDSRYPYLDEVQLLSPPDDMTRMLKIQAGEIDIATEVPSNQINSLRRVGQTVVLEGPSMRSAMLIMNLHSPALADVKVRRAIHFAIDREELVRLALFGHGEVARSFLPPMLYTDDRPPYTRQLAKARQLLAESTQPTGVTLRLVIGQVVLFQQVGVLLKSQLEPLGIRIQIMQVDDWDARVARGDYDLLISEPTSDIGDPDQLVNLFTAKKSWLMAMTHYANPKVDVLVPKTRMAIVPAQRKELYLELQNLIEEDAPFLGLFSAHDRIAARDNVHGFSILPTANPRLWEVWKSP
jgi:peptide/nickel transport system substrate-binding protein